MLPNIGLGELALIFFVLLIAVGPARLPEIARALGKAYRTFQRETTKAKDAFREVFDEPTSEFRQMLGDLRGGAEELTGTIEEGRAALGETGVIDRPDPAVIPGSGAEADPHAVLPAASDQPAPPPPARVLDHPTNEIVRDYEDT